MTRVLFWTNFSAVEFPKIVQKRKGPFQDMSFLGYYFAVGYYWGGGFILDFTVSEVIGILL